MKLWKDVNINAFHNEGIVDMVKDLLMLIMWPLANGILYIGSYDLKVELFNAHVH